MSLTSDCRGIATKVPEGEFDFLGFTFGRMYSPRTGQARLALRPSKKSIRRMVETIHELTIRSGAWRETTELVGKLNRALRGWANLADACLFLVDRKLQLAHEFAHPVHWVGLAPTGKRRLVTAHTQTGPLPSWLSR